MGCGRHKHDNTKHGLVESTRGKFLSCTTTEREYSMCATQNAYMDSLIGPERFKSYIAGIPVAPMSGWVGLGGWVNKGDGVLRWVSVGKWLRVGEGGWAWSLVFGCVGLLD